MTLRSLAQELTEPHLKLVSGRIGKVPPLLTELREHISHGTHEGGGNGTKQRILVNAQALDLLNTITTEARSAYTDRYGQPAPTLETCINTIGKGDHPPDWQHYFEQQYQRFITSIEATMRPKKLRRLDNIVCPSCQQATFGTERETCLYLDCYTGPDRELRHPSEWTVTCQACQATWAHKDMKWLIVALAQ